MVELSAKMKEFVAEVMLAVVGTRRRDNTVQMNPAWYEYRDGYFWLNSWRGSDWLRHIERDGDVTLFLLDPQNNGRWAQIQGTLVEASDEHGAAHIDALAHRYTGRPYDYGFNPRPRVRDPDRAGAHLQLHRSLGSGPQGGCVRSETAQSRRRDGAYSRGLPAAPA